MSFESSSSLGEKGEKSYEMGTFGGLGKAWSLAKGKNCTSESVGATEQSAKGALGWHGEGREGGQT